MTEIEALVAERDFWKALAKVDPGELLKLADDNRRMRAACSELLAAVKLGNVVEMASCSWCGENWPRLKGETFEQARDVAHEHAMQCEKHPLAAEVKVLGAELEGFARWLDAHPSWLGPTAAAALRDGSWKTQLVAIEDGK